MTIRPVRLRQKIIDDVQAAGTEESERILKVIEFARPRIRENQIELTATHSRQECSRILDDEAHAAIMFKMANRNRTILGLAIDRDEGRGRIHPIEDPCGRKTGAGSEFEHRAARLRGRQHSKERARARLTRHRKADRGGVAFDRIEQRGAVQVGGVIHSKVSIAGRWRIVLAGGLKR